MFAHIVAPHPPFVFGPDGSARRTRIKPFLFADGNQFPGPRSEYQAGYRDQMKFVIAKTKALIESLLSTAGPEPVIIIHGDHGPGLHLNWESAEQTDLEERLGIFAAYRFSGSRPLSQTISSPVNGARALATQYFGANLPNLPDESFFSGWSGLTISPTSRKASSLIVNRLTCETRVTDSAMQATEPERLQNVAIPSRE